MLQNGYSIIFLFLLIIISSASKLFSDVMLT